MTLQSIGFSFYAKIMNGSCVFSCSSCISFNPTSHFNRQELLQKAKDRYHNCNGKEKAAEFFLKKQKISIKTCQKKKKK